MSDSVFKRGGGSVMPETHGAGLTAGSFLMGSRATGMVGLAPGLGGRHLQHMLALRASECIEEACAVRRSGLLTPQWLTIIWGILDKSAAEVCGTLNPTVLLQIEISRLKKAEQMSKQHPQASQPKMEVSNEMRSHSSTILQSASAA